MGGKARVGGLLATAAWFRIRKGNQYLDTRTSPPVYTQDGLQENTGVELSLAGSVVPRLNVLAGTAWIKGIQKRTAGGVFDGKRAPAIPAFSARLNADYRVAGIDKLTLSGTVIYTGESPLNNLNTRTGPDWTRVDLGASYVFTLARTPLVARVSVENVAAAKYFVTASNNFLYQGSPRSVAVSLAAEF